MDNQAWREISLFKVSKEEKRKRSKEILKSLSTKYPFLRGAKVHRLLVRPVLEFQDDLAQRPYVPVKAWGGGSFLTFIPIKATFVPFGVLQTIRLILEHLASLGMGEKCWDLNLFRAKKWLDLNNRWFEEWKLPPLDVKQGIVLDDLFCLEAPADYRSLLKKANIWAKEHGLPEKMVEKFSTTEQTRKKSK